MGFVQFSAPTSEATAVCELSPAAERRCVRVPELLRAWRLPETVAAAAAWLPYAEEQRFLWLRLAPTLDPAVAALVNQWAPLHELTTVPTAGIANPAAARSLKLRRLMRQAYLNLPLVLLTVADHAARLEADPGGAAGDRDLWQDTRTVFLPLLHMLGLWELRRKWVEGSAKALDTAEFGRVQQILSRNDAKQQAFCADVQRFLAERNSAGLAFQLELHPPRAGRLIQRREQGDNLEELLELITFEAQTDSTAACYQLLELIHSLGAVLQGRFTDSIAFPHPNGYRALHTVVHSRFSDNPSVPHRLLEFRIYSADMQKLNQSGLIYDCYQRSAPAEESIRRSCWWHEPQVSRARALLQRREIGEPAAAEDETIYVFTPRGEVRQLSVGSTALDFAYRLHSQIGRHCRAVQINGHSAPHGAELHNGDLVFLEHDIHFRGPDPAWLHCTRSAYTRNRIKQGLNLNRRSSVPVGRQKLDRILEVLHKESEFVIPEPQLERYLQKAAEDLGLGDVATLYAAVEQPVRGVRVAPERLAAFVLEAELAAAVCDREGKPLVALDARLPMWQRPRLRFCANCKPVPGAPLILHRRRTIGGEQLTLHRASAIDGAHRCFGSITNIQGLDTGVQWSQGIGRVRQAANVMVVADNRPALVGDLLQPIYRDDRVDLTHIEAGVDGQGTADIWLTVECDGDEQLRQLKRTMEQVRSVITVAHWPATNAQTAHLKARHAGRAANPFTLLPCEPGMLYGREETLWQLRSWLETDRPQQLITLHGQRRSGKTSLVRLVGNYLRGSIRPVYVDLLFERTRPQTPYLLHLIAQTIDAELHRTGNGLPTPEPLDAWKDAPTAAWCAYLHQIERLLHPHRLLLILDEFNMAAEDCREPAFYEALRIVTLREFPGVTLLPVTHTVQFRGLAPRHPARLLYGQGVHLELLRLDRPSARRLVQEPTRAFLAIGDAVAQRIVTGADGHPLLINLICHELVQQARRSGRVEVALEDLRRAEEWLLRDGHTHFHFMLVYVDDANRPLLTELARRQRAGAEWVATAELERAARRPAAKTRSALQALHDAQVITLRTTADGVPQARIHIPYFAQWLDAY